jgi:hypothetical protein
MEKLSLCIFINIVARNCKYLCFHQHRGKEKTDIFSTCVFNNIVALTFIFYFPRFFPVVKPDSANMLWFNDLGV